MISFLHVVFAFACIALPLAMGIAFVDKTGFNRWLGILIVVPGVNVGLILFLLASTWPVQRELAVRRVAAGEGKMDDGIAAYREATRLQKEGRHEDATRLFGMIERRFPDTSLARDAAISREESERKNA